MRLQVEKGRLHAPDGGRCWRVAGAAVTTGRRMVFSAAASERGARSRRTGARTERPAGATGRTAGSRTVGDETNWRCDGCGREEVDPTASCPACGSDVWWRDRYEEEE